MGTSLINRVNNVAGRGCVGAADRRQWARVEEEKMRKERRIQFLARVRGTSIIRRGEFLR